MPIADASRLLKVIAYTEPMKMPPIASSATEIADITTWVKAGAPWPGASAAVPLAGHVRNRERFHRSRKSFWAFQFKKVWRCPLKNQSWIQTSRRFILSAGGERSNPRRWRAKEALLRRATLT